MQRIPTLVFLLVMVTLAISGCSGAAPAATPTAVPTTAPTDANTPALAPTSAPTSAPNDATAPAPAATTAPTPAGGDANANALRFVTVAGAGEARYRVREQLVNRDLPSDAIGATKDISGALVTDANGVIMADQSRFEINLQGLKSDSSRRDGFVANNVLQSSRFPTAVFVPTAAAGLPIPLPASGQGTFELSGDLTIRDVTRPVTWQITITREGDKLSGTAATSFTFKDFNLTQPRVPVLLSVQDTIKLEFDFQLQLAGA